jgi:hypothetical protein
MPINALLNLAALLLFPRLNTGFEHDDCALHIRSPQAERLETGNQIQGVE